MKVYVDKNNVDVLDDLFDATNSYECQACNRDDNLEIVSLSDYTKQVREEVCEKIKKQIFNHFNVKNMEEYENLSLIDSLFTADAVIEMLDTILKEYQK